MLINGVKCAQVCAIPFQPNGADARLQAATKEMEMNASEYVDTTQLARHTGIAASTWNKRRVTGDSPRWSKIGARVIYRLADVEKWIEERARRSTSDA